MNLEYRDSLIRLFSLPCKDTRGGWLRRRVLRPAILTGDFLSPVKTVTGIAPEIFGWRREKNQKPRWIIPGSAVFF